MEIELLIGNLSKTITAMQLSRNEYLTIVQRLPGTLFVSTKTFTEFGSSYLHQ